MANANKGNFRLIIIIFILIYYNLGELNVRGSVTYILKNYKVYTNSKHTGCIVHVDAGIK